MFRWIFGISAFYLSTALSQTAISPSLPPTKPIEADPQTTLPKIGAVDSLRAVINKLNEQSAQWTRSARVLENIPTDSSFPVAKEKLDDLNKSINANKEAEEWLQGKPINEPERLKRISEAVRFASRPVWVICGGKTWIPPDPLATEYSEMVQKVSNLKNLSAATGIITAYDYQEGKPMVRRGHVGTGVAVGRNRILTNKHVIQDGYLGYIDPGSSSWRLFSGIKATVSFPMEYDRCLGGATESRVVTIKGLAAVHPSLDLAILTTEEDLTSLVTFPTKDDLVEGDRIGVIGYPSRPGDGETFLRPSQIDAVFKAPDQRVPFPAERFAAGTLLTNEKSHEGYFSYDATTWGGSSGSLLVNIMTGAVIGLHSRGLVAKTQGVGYNEGIMSSDVAKFIASN